MSCRSMASLADMSSLGHRRPAMVMGGLATWPIEAVDSVRLRTVLQLPLSNGSARAGVLSLVPGEPSRDGAGVVLGMADQADADHHAVAAVTQYELGRRGAGMSKLPAASASAAGHRPGDLRHLVVAVEEAPRDIPIEDFREQVETNLLGVVNVTKAALPVLRKQREGYFIQVSSVGGRSVAPGLSAYQAAKWAVGGFSGVLAREVNPLGIKVTVLEPGGMSTDWAGSSMKVYPIRGPYEQSLGVLREALDSNLTASDPAKVAQVVLQLVELDKVPLHPASRQ
jgi:NAD(P)-dependent dehydrogenase (short-subunit alcohol dehydrogenase family)